jgi:hypothetical protein
MAPLGLERWGHRAVTTWDDGHLHQVRRVRPSGQIQRRVSTVEDQPAFEFVNSELRVPVPAYILSVSGATVFK